MLTVAKFPHAQASSCAMLLDEQALQSRVGQPLKLLVFLLWLVHLNMLKCQEELQRSKAGAIRGTYHRMEVFLFGFVFFLF